MVTIFQIDRSAEQCFSIFPGIRRVVPNLNPKKLRMEAIFQAVHITDSTATPHFRVLNRMTGERFEVPYRDYSTRYSVLAENIKAKACDRDAKVIVI